MRTARPSRTRHLIAVGVAASAAALGAVAVPAAADAAPLIPADAQHVTNVTVFLKAPHPAALAALAGAHGLSRAQRLQRLTDLVPSAATRRTVARGLAAEGLTVTGRSTWSLTATGTTGQIAATFGTRPTLPRKPSQAEFVASSGALPALPSRLADDVSAAFPTAAGPAVLHHMATSDLDGTDFRNADTPAGVTPSTGQNDAGTTIATVQFADFDAGGTSNAAASDTAADLTSYAKEHGLTDPVASGQYKAVHVAGGPSATDDQQGGDVEVDLDQESILSTAPTADQHAYFAPNTDAGFGDVFSAVYDDVTGSANATAPDPNITALSSSWGECEGDTGATAINAVEPMLESLTAAGVTVFSASGDDGIYDCRSTTGLGLDNTQADVDFPASSPVVVGVGGTNLSASTSAPNTGSNWTETGWKCTGPLSCEGTSLPLVGTGGSGGGASGSAYGTSSTSGTADFAGFAAPSYQTKNVTDAPFAGAKTRLVPDIAADGDPSTGFTVYTSDPQYVLEGGGSNDVEVGGTSLATPISAAQFDNALADAGITKGVGDIHNALYTAYADTQDLPTSDPKKVFRDVTSGTNGATGNKGTDPSVSAQAGYDTVSGLGGVLWSALVPYLTVPGAPTATGSLTLPDKTKATGTYTVKGTWTSVVGTDPAALASTDVSVTAVGASDPVYSTTSKDAAGTFTFAGKAGTTYVMTVTPKDTAGRTASATATVNVPIDDTGFSVTKGWARKSRSGDIGGSHLTGSAKSLVAKVASTGHTFSVRIVGGPSYGKFAVYRGGTLIKTIDGYKAKLAHYTFPIYTSSNTSIVRTFTFKPLGTKNAKSAGSLVALDDLVVTR
ncbi:S53 family peptidase [Jatrophihabitans endophyticus]|uniref:S53 family peptidase n=1 Tax=Jatrophihabitans endophyticus TaxID=1206085 RepID=UPI0019DAF7BB|nr:S53 family peptidase [Jatrophihabitans endophyticus]MBE7187027.1 hypothetical protein [Jatrophihabitans endophyticus]